MPDSLNPIDWRTRGIKHVAASAKSGDTPETLGMNREVAISGARTAKLAAISEIALPPTRS